MPQGKLRIARVAVTLREVKHVAGVARLLEQGAFEQQGVAAIGQRVACPDAVVVDQRAKFREDRTVPRGVGVDILVEHADEPPRQISTHELFAQIGRIAVAKLQVIRIRLQPGHLEPAGIASVLSASMIRM